MSPDATDQTRSFVPVPDGSDFPLQNLPYGVFRPPGGGIPRVGVRIGDHVVDLSVLEEAGKLREALGGPAEPIFAKPRLNDFMALGHERWSAVRRRLTALLSEDQPELRDDQTLRDAALLAVDDVEMRLPAEIGDYTDFYSSREHATNVGTMFRGADNALMPNWLHLPVAYHGRSSSVVISGTDVRRPLGQTLPQGAESPVFGPSKLMDYEYEIGFFTGPGNALGEPIPVDRAHEHIFGFVLVNDWSARDIQKWEYQPLGPFLAKNFATSISPWVVTLEALGPFRCAGPEQSDPEPLDYLRETAPWAFDIRLETLLRTPSMTEHALIAESNFRYMYWSVRQQLAHHTITGCPVRPGDLMASGTISGPDKRSRGCLLELTWKGTEPLELPGGEVRKFLQDGDTLTLRGAAISGSTRVGFGEVSGKILPAAE
jgi:fumarylacetoacetase